MTDPGAPAPADPAGERLTRLEEHAAFAERTVEQLSAEIADLNKRLHAMAHRMEVLEARIGRMLEPPPEPDAPPADA